MLGSRFHEMLQSILIFCIYHFLRRTQHDEILNRHKAQRVDEDDEEEDPATTSSSSTTPYSQNSHLKSSIGLTPHPVAMVTAKKKKEKKGKGRF